MCSHWTSLGFNVLGMACDVKVPGEREKLMEFVKSEFDGKLDILV